MFAAWLHPGVTLPLWMSLPSSLAATLTIPGDHPDLASAVAAAEDADEIVIDAVDLTGGWPAAIDVDVTIRGQGASATVLRHDGSVSGGISIQADVVFEDLLLDGAQVGRVLRVGTSHSLTLQRVILEDGVDSGSGGLVFASGDSVLTVTDSTLRGAQAVYGGAVVFYDRATGSFTDCIFDHNVVTAPGFPDGAAVRIAGSPAVPVVFTRCAFTDNENHHHSGGALSLLGAGASAQLIDTTFERNSAALMGGSVFLWDGSHLEVSGGSFVDNEALGGGAILCDGASGCELEIDGTHFEGNTAGQFAGGAIRLEGGELVLSDSTFVGNTSSDGGGAISSLLPEGSLSVRDTRFEGNTAPTGGAILSHHSDVSLTRSWFCDNAASGGGGAIELMEGPDVTITNSTFLANVGAEGGGIRMARGGTIASSTFAGNDSGALASGLAHTDAGSSVIVHHTVFTDHRSAVAVDSLGVLQLSHGASWDNAGGDEGAGVSASQLVIPTGHPYPGLAPSDCPPIVAPPWEGELVDAGDPLLADLDGSRIDLGATGGPDADPALWLDEDSDGVVVLWDCDDSDPRRAPDQIERPGDGIDNDCDGLDGLDDPTEPVDTGGTGQTDGPGDPEAEVPGGSASTGRARSEPGPSTAGCGCRAEGAAAVGWLPLLGLAWIRRSRQR